MRLFEEESLRGNHFPFVFSEFRFVQLKIRQLHHSKGFPYWNIRPTFQSENPSVKNSPDPWNDQFLVHPETEGTPDSAVRQLPGP